MTLNPRCFQSLCEDCARLSVEQGFHDLNAPNHPLRVELDQLDGSQLLRVAMVVHGAEFYRRPLSTPAPEPDETSYLGLYVVLTFLLGLLMSVIFIRQLLQP